MVPNIYTPKIGLLLSGDQDFPDSQHCKSIDFFVVFEKLYRAEFSCFTKTWKFANVKLQCMAIETFYPHQNCSFKKMFVYVKYSFVKVSSRKTSDKVCF